MPLHRIIYRFVNTSCVPSVGGHKISTHPGRPAGEIPKTVLAHAVKTAPDPMIPVEDPAPNLYKSSTTHPLCPLCTELLDRPLQLGCGAINCLRCCSSWIQFHHPPLSCPCCYIKLDSEHVGPPPSLVLSLIEGLLVYCVRGCGKIVRVSNYQDHLKGSCRTHFHQNVNSPS